jgi:glutathione S-transferase
MQLYGHPFSSCTQKVLVAMYEHDTPFVYRHVEDPIAREELAALSPLGKFPVLVDDGRTILETTAIIEHLQVRGAVRLIPDDDAGVEVRMLDRIFDHYVMTPMQGIVADRLRPEANRDPYGVEQARGILDRIYAWLDRRLDGRGWAAGDAFTLADCAAAPSLFYADWTHPIPVEFDSLRAYRARLLARPSMARAVDEARPYRHYFPLGAPDRD